MSRTKPPASRARFQLRTVRTRVLALIRTPLFWLITLWGHGWILIGAVLFQVFEDGKNPAVHGFLDSLGWAVGMVTTVGGNFSPVTDAGKVLAIMMMMGGALFLWSYMAFFVGALVDPELRAIERDMTELQHDVEAGDRLMIRLKSLTEELEAHLVSSSKEEKK